jgi:hypothetical protein
MGLQKYRFDITEPAANGVIVLRSDWMGGQPISGLRNCPCGDYGRRTVYVTGEPDTQFSIPAAISVKGKRVRGWIGCTDEQWEFHPEKA